MNDVDPATMTLAEIYGLPDDYFEPYDKLYPEYKRGPDEYGHVHRPYGGTILRMNGKAFFTVKDDGVDDHVPRACSWCSDTIPPGYWPWNGLSEDPEESKRAHP